MAYKKLWITLGVVMLVSFAVLGGVGYKAISDGPPIRSKVTTADGQVLLTGEFVRRQRMICRDHDGLRPRLHGACLIGRSVRKLQTLHRSSSQGTLPWPKVSTPVNTQKIPRVVSHQIGCKWAPPTG